MSDTTASLRHKIESATDLQAVVRTMKAVAASSIGQFENAVHSLDDYYRTVQLGMNVCLRHADLPEAAGRILKNRGATLAIVFGSDQGLVGQFNEVMVEFVQAELVKIPGDKVVWTVGQRLFSNLEETALNQEKSFTLPHSISSISPLVAGVLSALDTSRHQDFSQIYLFNNRPVGGAIYKPTSHRLLPFDQAWREEVDRIEWPTNNLPQVLNQPEATLMALIREYLFVSLFRACAESLAAENASRLAAMQRAEKNIDSLVTEMKRAHHRSRQDGIDGELFDLISGFESLREG